MIELAITLGLVFSLLSYEFFGLAAGGIVVPGYIALQLGSPERMAGILIVSGLTFIIIKCLGTVTLLYGRRQMVVCLLVGGILAHCSRGFLAFDIGATTLQLQAVGWVIPGLIAHWFGKQGVFKTVATLMVTAILVRLVVIISFNGQLLPA